MTDVKPEAREWWIMPEQSSYEQQLFNEDPSYYYPTTKGQLIHVIEYSAFEALQKELAEMTERHGDLSDACKLKQMSILELQRQRDSLREECEQLKADLSQYAFIADVASTELVYERLKEIPKLKAELEKAKAEVEGYKGVALIHQDARDGARKERDHFMHQAADFERALEGLLPVAVWFFEGPYGSAPEIEALEIARDVLSKWRGRNE